jgi:GAF domain-containing protein
MYSSIKHDIRLLDQEKAVLAADWKVAEHRLLAFCVKVVPRLMHAERCSILVAEADGSGAWLRAGTGLHERSLDESSIARLAVGEAMRTGKIVYRNDLVQAADGNQIVDASVGVVARDVLCMPIRSLDGSRVTGAIQVLNRKDGSPYSIEEQTLLEELLHYLELSVENTYFQQQAMSVIDRTWRLLSRVTAGVALGFFALVSAFTLYWFAFYLF